MQSGQLQIGADVTLPTFQCDECIKVVTFLGERMEVALTFALDRRGQPFDPAEPDGRLRLS